MSQSVFRKSGGIMVTEYSPDYVREILIGSIILVVCELVVFGVDYLWAAFPACFLISIGYILVVRPIVIEFDRRSRIMTVIRPGMFGLGLFTSTRAVPFTEVAWVEVRSRRDRTGGTLSALKLRLKSEEGIDVCGYELESGQCMRKARALTEFMSLSVPPKIE